MQFFAEASLLEKFLTVLEKARRLVLLRWHHADAGSRATDPILGFCGRK